MSDVSALDYFEHAKEINSIAGKALRLDTKDASALSAKISLGLSLQAAELVGKGLLRALGYSIEDIRKSYKNHDVLTLLRYIEKEVEKRSENELESYYHFLLWAPEIDGTEFRTTISGYLEEHFSQGKKAYPRSYFYPDENVFTGPVPIHALYIMVCYLIEIAEEINKIVGE